MTNTFEGTTSNPGSMALAMLEGYYAYKGWELVTVLPEEMINPKRDMPLALMISIVGIIAIYVMTNVAYFSALTPAEIISSQAVALAFTEKVLGKIPTIFIAVSVALSCMGAVNSGYLTDSRYLFAAGRNKQVPQLLSMINITQVTPLPALLFMAFIYFAYSLIPSLDQLVQYSALGVQIKIAISIIALLRLKWQKPDAPRRVSVHWSIAVFCILVIVVMIVLSIYQNPLTAVSGLGLCMVGLPLYGIMKLFTKFSVCSSIDDKVTVFFQMLMLVVPETSDTKTA